VNIKKKKRITKRKISTVTVIVGCNFMVLLFYYCSIDCSSSYDYGIMLGVILFLHITIIFFSWLLFLTLEKKDISRGLYLSLLLVILLGFVLWMSDVNKRNQQPTESTFWFG